MNYFVIVQRGDDVWDMTVLENITHNGFEWASFADSGYSDAVYQFPEYADAKKCLDLIYSVVDFANKGGVAGINKDNYRIVGVSKSGKLTTLFEVLLKDRK